MHPFLDPRTLTDDQLLEKIDKAYAYINFEKKFGRDMTVHSIQEVIETLEEEHRNRLNKVRYEEINKKLANSKPIEIGKLED